MSRAGNRLLKTAVFNAILWFKVVFFTRSVLCRMCIQAIVRALPLSVRVLVVLADRKELTEAQTSSANPLRVHSQLLQQALVHLHVALGLFENAALFLRQLGPAVAGECTDFTICSLASDQSTHQIQLCFLLCHLLSWQK